MSFISAEATSERASARGEARQGEARPGLGKTSVGGSVVEATAAGGSVCGSDAGVSLGVAAVPPYTTHVTVPVCCIDAASVLAAAPWRPHFSPPSPLSAGVRVARPPRGIPSLSSLYTPSFPHKPSRKCTCPWIRLSRRSSPAEDSRRRGTTVFVLQELTLLS
ncbi:uncharacterized protein LOC122250904 [Penaeus japonicus]|uniref:uncharacterized protein LOC122250904 n=1 Tax=Penaeus japonicus TaxID=27405 RepID=UPI001C7106FA|nr:uncharacterized protein LOC122250904 [Penaeus japonicus]